MIDQKSGNNLLYMPLEKLMQLSNGAPTSPPELPGVSRSSAPTPADPAAAADPSRVARGVAQP